MSSFHSTLNALKGLLFYESVTGGTDAIRAARSGGEEYLLRRYLYKRLSSGEPVAPWVSRFVYPFRWFYSVLNAAEYFREASLLDGRPPDPRMAEAIEQIRTARHPDGTWILYSADRRLRRDLQVLRSACVSVKAKVGLRESSYLLNCPCGESLNWRTSG